MSDKSVSANEIDFVILASSGNDLYTVDLTDLERENINKIIRLSVKGLYEVNKKKSDLDKFLGAGDEK